MISHLVGIPMESKVRSLVKAISWRVVATITTVILAFVFTGNWAVSGSIGISELVIKIMVYYLHERFWNSVSYGIMKDKKKP